MHLKTSYTETPLALKYFASMCLCVCGCGDLKFLACVFNIVSLHRYPEGL